jgi:hypothetical protein
VRLRELLAGATVEHRRAVAGAIGLAADAPAARIAEALEDEERLASIVAGLSGVGRAAATAGAFAGRGAVFQAPARAGPAGVLELERHGLVYAFGRSWWREYGVPDDLLAPLARVRAAAHAARVPEGESGGDARFVGAPLQLAHDAAVLSAFMAREPVRVKADGQIYARTRPKLAAAVGQVLGTGSDETAAIRVDMALEWLREEGLLRLRVDDLPGRETRRELVAAGDPARSLAAEPAALRERLATFLVRYDELRCTLALTRALEGRVLSLAALGEALGALLEEAQVSVPHAFEAVELALTCSLPLWLAGELELGFDDDGGLVAARLAAPEPPAGSPGPLAVAQGNFELVLLRPPGPAERRVLELCCERAAGQEHVFQITRAAARAAQRAGAGPGGVAGALAELAGELPQNVARSLDDWTRDVRAPLRLRSAMLVDAGDGASADALAAGPLAELVVERLGERMLAVPASRLDEVTHALRATGAELEPGLERISGAWEERMDASEPARRRWEPAVEDEPGPRGDQVSTIEPDAPQPGPEIELGAGAGAGEPLVTILEALERDSDLVMVYAGARGVTHRVVTPIDVDESRLHAYCHLRDDERSFWLSSILAAGAAPD